MRPIEDIERDAEAATAETAAWTLSADGSIYHYDELLGPGEIYAAIVGLENKIERLEIELKPYRYMFRPIVSEKSAERITNAVCGRLGGVE